MSHRYVEMLIGRLTTDPALRRRYEASPTAVVRELAAEGYDLSPIEIEALAGLDWQLLGTFAATVDPRLRRVDHDLRTSTRK